MTQKIRKVTVSPIYHFHLEDEKKREFQSSDQIKLQRIKSDELAKIKEPIYIYVLGTASTLLNSQTFVFEINHDDFGEASRQVYEVLLAMRLLKSGSVFCKVFWIEEDTKINRFFTINPSIPWGKSKYLLNVNEIDEIKKLLNKIVYFELNKKFFSSSL